MHWGLSWNGPAWSAALEFHVSILFAVVVLLFPRRKYDVFLGLCVAAARDGYGPSRLFDDKCGCAWHHQTGALAACDIGVARRARSTAGVTRR